MAYSDFVKTTGEVKRRRRQFNRASVRNGEEMLPMGRLAKKGAGARKSSPFTNLKFKHTTTDGYCVFPIGGDTYRGCSGGCLYCYSVQLDNQHMSSGKIVPANPKQLFDSLYKDSDVAELLQHCKAVKIGTITDPFPVLEVSHGVTYRLLEMLCMAGIAPIITTKFPQHISDKYLSLIKAADGVVKVSFSTFNAARAKMLERGVVSPLERVENMKRIKRSGVKVVARIDPWLRTEDYDYSFLKGAVDGVILEFLRYSILWRSSWPAEFWGCVFNETAPLGEQKPGTSRYGWAVQREKRYFKELQEDREDFPYSDPGYRWVYMSMLILRDLVIREKTKIIQQAKVDVCGVCNVDQGINNIDLYSKPYCCAVNPETPYDRMALVPQWHEDKWKKFLIPKETRHSTLYNSRALCANDPMSEPLVWQGKKETVFPKVVK